MHRRLEGVDYDSHKDGVIGANNTVRFHKRERKREAFDLALWRSVLVPDVNAALLHRRMCRIDEPVVFKSDVTVTDGSMTARAVSFFSVEAGKITRIVEYWPESYAAPANRAHLVERIE
ncbi:ketosteroid isomerase-like protein [Paraburkholderia sp. GAS33]|uniref:hypothetical protein n=1 Tax=Paraburkholderia sp. GAS33 TaxID=3035130 RepID=UPI003D2564C4